MVALSSPKKADETKAVALRACWQCVEAKFADHQQTYLMT
jgi:hypothetical protein